MSTRPAISVAMAVLNGMPYLKEQLESILANLNEFDEIVISDDGSSDETLKLIKEYQAQYGQIRLVEGPCRGVKQNVANAIQHCRNDLIFLSDQDDIWDKNKVNIVLFYFKDLNCMVVNHNAQIIGADGIGFGQSTFEFRHSKPGILRNIWKNSYMGCCMAFRRELIPYILPIPDDIEMHDQWIGLIGEKVGSVCFLDQKLINYRRHSNNNSEMHHHSLSVMLSRRIHLIWQFIRRVKKMEKAKNEKM